MRYLNNTNVYGILFDDLLDYDKIWTLEILQLGMCLDLAVNALAGDMFCKSA